MIVSQKDIFLQVFRGMSDDDLYAFLKFLNLSSSIVCKMSAEKVKEIVNEMLDDEALYDEDLLTDKEIKLLSQTVKDPRALSALARE